jgi:hypothetical protein
MSNRRSHLKLEESEYIHQVAGIMAAGTGPYTRKQLALILHRLHPELSMQELLNVVSTAINDDKRLKQKFKFVSRGWWNLNVKG